MKDFLYECLDDWGCLIPIIFVCVLAVLYFSDKQGFMEVIMGRCTHSVGEIVPMTIPTEEVTVTYAGIKLKKARCLESLFIEIADMPDIPKNFTGTLKVEITKIVSLYRYSGKIIHIKPNQRMTQ